MLIRISGPFCVLAYLVYMCAWQDFGCPSPACRASCTCSELIESGVIDPRADAEGLAVEKNVKFISLLFRILYVHPLYHILIHHLPNARKITNETVIIHICPLLFGWDKFRRIKCSFPPPK